MTADEMYQQARAAYMSGITAEIDRLTDMIVHAEESDEGRAIVDAYMRAQDEYFAERYPKLRARIGDLAASGEVATALLLDRIFFGDPDIE